MATAKITSKGQVTIPAEVRAALGLKTGDRIDFVEAAPGRYEVVPTTVSLRSLKGILHRPGMKAMTIEEMNRAIARAAAGLE